MGAGSEEEDDQGEEVSGSDQEEEREGTGNMGDNVYRRERTNQITREERDKIRKLKNAFVNYRPLDSMVSAIMLKYGLRLRETINADQTKVDPDALLMFSEGLRMKLD